MSRIQNEDVKSEAQLVAAGGQKSQLPNDSKVYVSALDLAVTLQEYIEAEFPQPLRLYSTPTTPDAVLNIGSSIVTRADGTERSAPPISSNIAPFDLSTINFQTRAVSNPSIAIEFPDTPVGEFRRVGFTYLADGTLQAIFSPSVALIGDLDNPGTVFAAGGTPVGWLELESTDGTPGAPAFKTAGSATDIIENRVGADARVHVFGSGGSGSGTGNANSFREDLKVRLRDCTLLANRLTPNIFSETEDTLTDDVNTTATFNVAESSYVMNQSGEIYQSSQLFGSRFLANDQSAMRVETHILYGAFPEATPQVPISQITTVSGVVAISGIDVNSRFAQTRSIPSAFNISQASVRIDGGGSTGNARLEVWGLNGGVPDIAQVLAVSTPRDITTFTGQAFNSSSIESFSFPNNESIPAGDVALVLVSDDVSGLIRVYGTNGPFADGDSYFGSTPFANGDFTVETNETWEFTIDGFTGGGSGDPITDVAYEVSQNGGGDWQIFTPNRIGESNKLVGVSVFPPVPATLASLIAYAPNSLTNFELNATDQQDVAIPLVIASKSKTAQITVDLNKEGTPIGNYRVALYDDNNGVPGGVLASTSWLPVSDVVDGDSQVTLSIQKISPAVDRVWARIETDVSYKTSFGTGVDALSLRVDSTALSYSEGNSLQFNGSSWSDSGVQPIFNVEGFVYDLRVRLTSASAGEIALEAFGIFYGDAGANQLVESIPEELFEFDGGEDLYEFEITKFVPNPRMRVYDVTSRSVIRYPEFSLSGQKVIFAPGSFLDPGNRVRLIFDMSIGGGFDNSDENALLMSENRLGSLDPNLDRSVAGEGGLHRADNNKLVETSLRWTGTKYEWVFAEVE